MATPYITPAMAINAPTGISWQIIPFPKATSQQQFEEQTNMCWRATGIIDAFLNFPIRATIDTEINSGPDFRVTIQQDTGNARVILQRWPILQILAVQVANNAIFPRQYVSVPAGMFDIENPIVGLYGTSAPSGAGEGGQSILIAPSFVNFAAGRRGFKISTSYVNGWPHAGLTASAVAGATTLTVDDVTGFTGASAFIYDGGSTEVVQVTSVTPTTPLTLPNGGGTAPAGPGTLTLASPLVFAHSGSVPATVVVSSIPQNVLYAAILHTAAQALEAGITSISIQNIPGSLSTGGKGVHDLLLEADLLLTPFKRTI